MNHHRAPRPLRTLVAGLPFVAAAVVAALVRISVRDRLPDPMATHFTGNGHPDGFSSTGGFLAVSVPVLLGAGVLLGGTAAWQRVAPARWTAVLAWATAGLLGSVTVSVLRVNAAVDDAHDARLPWWHLVAACGVAAVAGAIGWALTRTWPRGGGVGSGEAAEGTPLTLGASEQAVWVRTTGSWQLGLIAGALAVAGGVALALGGWWGSALLVAGVATAGFGWVQVVVGPKGVVVSQVGLPWPRIRIPLQDIESASRRDVGALTDFGGWGYRIRPRASGVILRSGEALVVRKRGGREFAVTVDDAATAAALVNSLLARTGGKAASC
ncbi:DUF1648 domain-containing protein [Streptomyces sp. VRA16 Mangrove soil]|uniref:DUF1648 domain-containing protein n=1 Tax=Streptomyces sp. VRA16 Mangrove soil TaxID=2817434 RepID=UPI001A9DFCFC|nr:DUF1648 domain-containing protein [Streptomyces sp. VRA16 Mangrove soil]MBO1334727.1 DUF1648 domain-containing protein [Streptomyces sp. VRA16 Mangrove soil]